MKELWTLIIYVGLKACKMFLSDPRTSYNKHKHRRNEVQRSGYAEDEEKKQSRTTIKHFNLKLLVVLFVIVQWPKQITINKRKQRSIKEI